MALLCVCRDLNSALLEPIPYRPPAAASSSPTRHPASRPSPITLLPKADGAASFSTPPSISHFRSGLRLISQQLCISKCPFFVQPPSDPRRLGDGNSTRVVCGTANSSINRSRGYFSHQTPDFLQAATLCASTTHHRAFSARIAASAQEPSCAPQWGRLPWCPGPMPWTIDCCGRGGFPANEPVP